MNILKLTDATIASVPNDSVATLIQKCKAWGMQSQPFQDSVSGGDFPSFDCGYHFKFNTDEGQVSFFEILEKDDAIMQAGFQVLFPPALFASKSKGCFERLSRQLTVYYGTGTPMKAGPAFLMNFKGSESVGYVSRLDTLSRNVVTIRIGNMDFWS